jgi:hypothetical protein
MIDCTKWPTFRIDEHGEHGEHGSVLEGGSE